MKEAEQLPTDVTFHFTQEQWQRIARELGPDAEKARSALEMWAGELPYFRKRRREWDKFSVTEEKDRFERMGASAGQLLSEIRKSELYGSDFAAAIFGDWSSTDDDEEEDLERDLDQQLAYFESKWETFIFCLNAFPNYCVHQARLLARPRPANVDEDRNAIWAAVAEIYWKTKGREPSAIVGAEGSKSQGIAGGPFVRFIQAWMAAVPGESEPKPEEVRWFIRRRWPELKPPDLVG
jgi:hypothetical protein